jgi:hypothetical protein
VAKASSPFHPRGPVQHLTEVQKIKIISLQQIVVNPLAIPAPLADNTFLMLRQQAAADALPISTIYNSRLTNYYHFYKKNGSACPTISSRSSGAPFHFGVKYA